MGEGAPGDVALPIEDYAYDEEGNRLASHLSSLYTSNDHNQLLEDDDYSRHTPSQPKVPTPYNANVAMIFGGDPTHPEFAESLAAQPINHFKRSPSISLSERIFSPESENLPV